MGPNGLVWHSFINFADASGAGPRSPIVSSWWMTQPVKKHQNAFVHFWSRMTDLNWRKKIWRFAAPGKFMGWNNPGFRSLRLQVLPMWKLQKKPERRRVRFYAKTRNLRNTLICK